jgi:crotonobetainyl-CoA:carnitine CoA-transferase CaiB-like acyl-CoA transferase
MRETGLYDKFDQAALLDFAASRGGDLNLSKIGEDEEEAAIANAAREAMNFMAENLDPYDYFVGAQERGIQVGIIYAPEDVIEDPHFVARGFPTEVEHPELGKSFTYPGAPYQFRGSPWAISRRPPLIGEHNAEVFAEIGVDASSVT